MEARIHALEPRLLEAGHDAVVPVLGVITHLNDFASDLGYENLLFSYDVFSSDAVVVDAAAMDDIVVLDSTKTRASLRLQKSFFFDII